MTQPRPLYHISPPRGWMNDPCAPSYDANIGRYHVFFQWVPEQVIWSNRIGWGHAWSSDLVHWEYDQEPSLMPSEKYDCMGVFTGSVVPSAQPSTGMTVVYSAINSSFMGDPDYAYGQERLAVATSKDGGMTWEKCRKNPLPVMPPADVTGWRDPFLGFWPELSSVMGNSPALRYGLISGGLKNQGSTLFLYEVDDLLDWRYIGPLVAPRRPKPRPTSIWGGDWGTNWECGGFFELGGTSFLVVAPQGHWFESLEPIRSEAAVAPKKWQLWASGHIQMSEGRPHMTFEQEGVLDWGCLYAAQTFVGSGGRRLVIVVGWLPEDDLTEEHRKAQGYYGHMSSVREFFVQTVEGVMFALKTPLDELPGFSISANANYPSIYQVSTLGIRPIQEVVALRGPQISLQSMPLSRTWEAEMDVVIGTATAVGLRLSFAEGEASIVFYPEQERIVVDRTKTTKDGSINTFSEYGTHSLFRFTSGWEPLKLRVFLDSAVLEVFANDRFALTTHVYGGPCTLSMIKQGGEVASVESRAWDTRRSGRQVG